MKVIIKKTGKLANVEFERSSGYDGYRDTITGDWYYANQVKVADNIDWEQRRYELAKAAMQGILANYYHHPNINIYALAEVAYNYADAMIEKMKEVKK